MAQVAWLGLFVAVLMRGRARVHKGCDSNGLAPCVPCRIVSTLIERFVMPGGQIEVLITDHNLGDLREERSVLEESGLDVLLRVEQCTCEDEVILAGHGASAFVTIHAPISRRVMEECPRVEVVARYGIGVDSIDVAAATDCGVCVANVPDYCVDEVSDHALTLLLALARNIVRQANSTEKGEWDYRAGPPVRRLRGKTVGLVGFGRTARRLTPKVQALGMTVLAYDPHVDPGQAAGLDVQLVALEQLADRADFVVNMAPLTDETRGMLGETLLSRMKPTALVVSVSRGGIVDEKALLSCLQDGALAGAALDVRETEPTDVDELVLLDNVIITPHMAFYSEESIRTLKTETMREVVRVLKGERPRSWVNPQPADRLRMVARRLAQVR